MLFIPPPAKADREEVEEAGYLASASDLMVGLLFVFIIMVVILSQRVEEAESGSKSNDPLESAVRTIGKKIQQAGVPVVIDPASGVITLPADTLFPKGLAELNSGGIEVLGRAKVALNGILPCYIFSERKNRINCPPNPNEVEIETIFIEGHTDSTPLQRGIYTNWHLGLDRAHAVYDGWHAGAQPREILQVKNKDGKLAWPEAHDYKKGKRRFKSDLIPAPILIASYFTTERDAIDALDVKLTEVEQQLQEMMEDNSGEEGLLAEVIEGEGDKQKITAKVLKARLKEIGKDPDYADERKALQDYTALLDKQTDVKGKLKAAQDDLEAKLDAKYPKLTEVEIKTLRRGPNTGLQPQGSTT